ncbi:MAG: hypothetical protein QM535_14010 [Limnohabitans sp.]|nr:hypothetical protein [Limnohabitans sp.]
MPFKKIFQLLQLILPTFMVFYLCIGCENKKSELEFEKNVMAEIYADLMDSLWVHDNSLHSVTFLKLDKKGNVIGYEQKNKNEIRKEFKKKLEEIKERKAKIFAGIIDTIAPSYREQTNELIKYYKEAVISNTQKKDTLKYSINREQFSKVAHIKVKFISKYDGLGMPWSSLKNHTFSGIISFSRIQFDDNKKFGIFDSSIVCGGLCGNGYQIFIKKINNKWIVEKVEYVWVS